ncbi:MAG: hypothetical protein HRT71_01070 [Flavobacteriales bacterium]|nr:hypothetical protein [Flavobacteriales bacterium]
MMNISTKNRKLITAQLIGVVSLLMSQLALGQNFEEDLKLLGKNYKSGNYNIEVDYTFYAGHSSNMPLENQTNLIKKHQGLFHTKQFGLELISNKNHVLIIDHNNQVIAIEKQRKNKKPGLDKEDKEDISIIYKQMHEALGIDMETTKSNPDDIKTTYLGLVDGQKRYRMSYKYGEYEHMDLYIDSKNYLLKEVWLYFRAPMEIENGYRAQPKVRLVYAKQDTNPVYFEQDYSIEAYVKIMAKGKVEIIDERYRSFDLINHLLEIKEQ